MQFTHLKLDDRVQRAINALGYTDMTPIQEAAIPPCLAGRDLVGTAQTGTGKTAAFVIPIIEAILATPRKPGRVRALIVTPTRELAEQVNEVVQQLTQFTKIRSTVVYGGVGIEPQRRSLRKGSEIVVACPGRLLDLIARGNADLSALEILVLDEADRMFDMGFLPQVREIVAKIPRDRRTMLYSATFAPELDRLVRDILRNPERITMGMSAPAETVQHRLCPVEQNQKTTLLLRLLEETETESVLIFTRTKHRADRVHQQIKNSGLKAAVLHSNRTQSQRKQALDGFRSGRYQLLVATDIAARGLDIASVSHVINYDIPNTVDDYIHRIGRTGRAERQGDALTLVTADDRITVGDIEQALGQRIEILATEGFDYGRATGPLKAPIGSGRKAPVSFHSRTGRHSRGGSKPQRRPSSRRASA